MIHKYSLFDKNIVLDVYSGAVHVFDDVSYDVLEYYETLSSKEIIKTLGTKYDEEDINGAINDIGYLKEKDLLFSKDPYTQFIPHWSEPSVVKALCLHISHDCNLRCKYCFAKEGSFGGERKNMTFEVGKYAIDFLIKESKGRKNLEIDFFGGEPLLNFDVVKEIVSYARSKERKNGKKFKFTLTTNSLLLNNEIIQYINDNMDNIVLSIDGREETNDKMRIQINKKGTYSKILPKIKQVVSLRGEKDHYVRGTFTRENIDFSKDVLHLADEGFKQISVEPVVAALGSGLDLREEDLPTIFLEYEKLASEYIEREKRGEGFNFFHFMIDLSQGPCVIKRLRGCGSGHEYLAITPDGDIFPCHQFVGMDAFKMGNVSELEYNKDIGIEFKNSNVYTKEDCKNCWAKFYCSGGCAANAYQFNKDIGSTYKIGCELEKKRVECAIWIKTQI